MFDDEKKIRKIEKQLKYNEEEYKNSQHFRNNINQTILFMLNQDIKSSKCLSY